MPPAVVRRGRRGWRTGAGVVLREVRDLNLHQIAAWPDTLAQVGEKAAQGAGVDAAPGPCASAVCAVDGATQSALLRVEPLKWWMLGGTVPRLAPEQGTTLDLSHSRTHLRITGPQAATLLNRHLPLDLREGSFPEGAVGVERVASRRRNLVAFPGRLRVVHSPRVRVVGLGSVAANRRSVWRRGYS